VAEHEPFPGAEALQNVALQAIQAARGALDLAEKLIEDPEVARRFATAMTAFVKMALQVGAAASSTPASPGPPAPIPTSAMTDPPGPESAVPLVNGAASPVPTEPASSEAGGPSRLQAGPDGVDGDA
jgi:hypothetical protein